MQNIHHKLKEKFYWYGFWHNHPRHQHAHWLVVFSAVLILSTLIIFQLFTLKFENYGFAQAQTNLPAPNHNIFLGYYLTDINVQSSTNFFHVFPYSYFNIAAGSNGSFTWQEELADSIQRAANRNEDIMICFSCFTPEDMADLNFYWNEMVTAATPVWDRIYIEIAHEAPWDATEMENRINQFWALLAQRGLPRRPIGAVFTRSTIENQTNNAYTAPSLDWVAVEGYLDPPGSSISSTNVNDLNNFITLAKSRIPSNKNIVLIMQAYNRNGGWTNMETLKDLQSPIYLQAYNDPRVIGILMFSYLRAGGTFYLDPCIRTEHQRIWGAISGTNQPPSIPCSAVSDTDPIGTHNSSSNICATATTNGWTCDGDNTFQALTADLYIDGPRGTGTLIGQPIANLDFGSFVGSQCGGNNNHGFSFNIPSQYFDGTQHNLYAYGVNIGGGSDALLTDSPQSFTCGTPPPPGSIPPGGIPPPPPPGPVSTGITPTSTSPSGPNPCTQDQINTGVQFGVIVVCDFSPSTVNPGDTIEISGVNLTSSLRLTPTRGGSFTNLTGVLSNSNSVLTFTAPNLPDGDYSLSVFSGVDESNISKILMITSLPIFRTSNDPIGPALCTLAEISLGIPIICDVNPNIAFPGDLITLTGIGLSGRIALLSGSGNYPIFGSANSNGTQASFRVPVNVPDGVYSVADGIAISDETLTVTQFSFALPPGQPPPPFNPPPPPTSPPPATDFQDLLNNILTYSVYLVGIAVFIMFLWAGFLWMTSAANPSNIAAAKKIMTNAVLGAILLISSYVILYTINPELVGGTLNLPGLQTNPSGTGTSSSSVTNLIAFNEPAAAAAITNGCFVRIERGEFTAIQCPSSLTPSASGLVLDPIITPVDANTNNQIGAMTLQNSGNQGNGQVVVILDSGYNYTHPELSSSYLGGRDFVNNDNDPMDDQIGGAGAPGHGSHVAGIITADGIDSQARGVAPGAGIVSGKILDSRGNGKWSDMIDAIYWAVNGPDGINGTSDDFGTDIINMSVGGGLYASICDNQDDTTRQLAQAISYARNHGILVVAATGNNSSGVTLPGCIDDVLAVGAVDSSDNIASFSGRGAGVDVVAPGVNIYSSLLGSTYGTKTGTSMATPVVSGLAALLKSANPGQSVDQLQRAITSSACELGASGWDNIYGWGRVTGTPGSCTPAPSPPSTAVISRLNISPVSCTIDVTNNFNCDITLDYSITGLSSSTTISVIKDGLLFQNIQCGTSVCSGQIIDSSPSTGIHRFSLQLPSGVTIANANSYIISVGSITTNYGLCIPGSNAANPNCDVTLNVSATTPPQNYLIVTKDGLNWRVINCPSSSGSCFATLTDPNPSTGIHTYSLRDLSNPSSTLLGRQTIEIATSATCNIEPNATMELCTGTNFTGTCQTFNCHGQSTFIGSSLAGQSINSARFTGPSSIQHTKVYTCETGWVHPNPSATEPTPCLWKYVPPGTGLADIWTPANDWCYWTWVNGVHTIFCGQPTPASPGIRINSYGGLYPDSW